MRSLHLWLLLAMVPWLAGSGCPKIYSEQPLGQEIATLDPQKVNGLWLWPGGAISGVRVLNSEQGTLAIWDALSASDARDYRKKNELPPLSCEPPTPKVEGGSPNDPSWATTWRRYPYSADSQNGWYFYFPEQREASGEPYFTDFVLLSDGESSALVYLFTAAGWHQEMLDKRLKELVEQEALPGRIEPSGRVLLGPLKPEHYHLILTYKTGLFDWTKPFLPLIKLPPGLDPCKKSEQRK